MYIAPWQGQTASRGQNFYVNRNVLTLHSFVAGLKKNSVKCDFMQVFYDFIHVYKPKEKADNPLGLSCHFGHLLQVSKTSL